MKRFVSSIAMLVLVATIWNASAERARAEFSLDVNKIKLSMKVTDLEDQGFIARAVIAVKSGQLPRSIFESTYRWALKRQTNRFQYFRRALILRAAKVGVSLS